MPLERQSIEKKDFQISRRGYDVQEVDAHLKRLADEMDELKRSSSQRRPESLAAMAGEEVQAIVAAAETAATKIRGDAERDGEEIRRLARNEAKTLREEAGGQAAQHVSRVSESAGSLLQRVEAIDRELTSVVESVRSAGTKLKSELSELEGSLGDVRSFTTQPPGAVPAAGAERAPGHPDEDETDHDDEHDESGFDEEHEEPGHEDSDEETELASPATGSAGPPAGQPRSGEPVAAAPGGNGQTGEATSAPGATREGESQSDGARLIALNMALNGAPREEVDRYLAENFDIPNRDGLIDEVYAAIED